MTTAEAKDYVKKQFTDEGYKLDENLNLRNKAFKQLVQAVELHGMQFILCEDGYTYTREKNGYEWNIKITIPNGKGEGFCFATFHRSKHRVTLHTLLMAWSKMIRMDAVKEILLSSANGVEYVDCHKCCGQGIISYYMHVYNGICFDCLGTGKQLVNFTVKTPQK